jgi:hypothetical protein
MYSHFNTIRWWAAKAVCIILKQDGWAVRLPTVEVFMASIGLMLLAWFLLYFIVVVSLSQRGEALCL